MCKSISWLEFDLGNILYLTDEEIFNTKKGKNLQEYCKDPVDLVGHGAINWYYDITGRQKREVNDFSTPKNFPNKIVTDFKNGKMKKMIIDIEPLLIILSQSALIEYEKVERSALVEYGKVKQSAWIEYEKVEQPALVEYEKVEQSALIEYEKVKQPALVEYEKVKQSAWIEYEKVKRSALVEYEKVERSAFWDLFSNPENRIIEWR